MSDIRTRIADALHDNGCHPDDAAELADALLSLPGIAIVELPEADEDGHWLDGDVRAGMGKVRHYQEDPRLAIAEAREIAAALLAAANAAEAPA